jgi:serine/threonine protein kinase
MAHDPRPAPGPRDIPHAENLSGRVNDFLGNLARSGLLPRADAEALLRGPNDPARTDASILARRLIDRGHLTAYQARKLLAGVTRGFFLGGYRILRDLGEGGMGKVFLARRDTDNELVAIKVLPPRKAFEDPRALARFRRETELSRRVRHPNVARTLDVGSEAGVNFMVMEYVPGRSLHQLVTSRAGGPWRVPDAARYFVKVLDGLQAAHQAGLVHRDIKPSNLMVTPGGDARILDLGLARALGEVDPDATRLTRDNAIVGTLDYASPEQLSDAATADPRSDLYSLGCSLYFALAGAPPFPGGDVINKIYRQRMEDPPPLETIAPGVPASFAAIVRKLMAKDPAHRHQSAAEARADLLRWTDPALARALLGADAEQARAFRPPPPQLDDEDLLLLDSSAAGPSGASALRRLGDPAPAPAPRTRPPASASSPESSLSTLPRPPLPSEGLPPWILWLIAALACILAIVVLLVVAINPAA